MKTKNHPRTAVGVRDDELVFVVVDGDDTYGGCTLPDLQDIGVQLNLTHMLNLDGGGSSQFRLMTDNGWLSNNVPSADRDRVLGHVIVLFDDTLK